MPDEVQYLQGVAETDLVPMLRTFLQECRAMLQYLGEAVIRPDATGASLQRFRGKPQLALQLRSPRDPETIEVSASAKEIVVALEGPDFEYAHWHFTPDWNDVYPEVADRAWTSLPVDFLAELIQGEVRVSVTYRGTRAVRAGTDLFRLGGERLTLGSTGVLAPALVNLFAKRRVEERSLRFHQ